MRRISKIFSNKTENNISSAGYIRILDYFCSNKPSKPHAQGIKRIKIVLSATNRET